MGKDQDRSRAGENKIGAKGPLMRKILDGVCYAIGPVFVAAIGVIGAHEFLEYRATQRQDQAQHAEIVDALLWNPEIQHTEAAFFRWKLYESMYGTYEQYMGNRE